MDYKLILDIIVAVLLAATISYAAMLNGRLSQLRKSREDLARLVAAFNDATARAEAGIPRLKKVAEEAGSGLQERVEKAQSLRDDLAFMIERADAMANRLEGTVRAARVDARPSPAPAATRPGRNPAPAAVASAAAAAAVAAAAAAAEEETDEIEDDRSEAERELLRALQSVR